MNRYYSVRIIFHNTILGLPYQGSALARLSYRGTIMQILSKGL